MDAAFRARVTPVGTLIDLPVTEFAYSVNQLAKRGPGFPPTKCLFDSKEFHRNFVGIHSLGIFPLELV